MSDKIPEIAEAIELKSKLVELFNDSYQSNDPAHRVDHFDRVRDCGLYINGQLKFGYVTQLIYAVAYIHDAFSWCLDNHQSMSAHWVETTKNPIMDIFSGVERKMIADACREHRASYKGEYSSIFSELMASADRMIPVDALTLLERSVLYTEAQGHAPELARVLAKQHIKEKYGFNGYARYPKMYEEVFAIELLAIRKEIERM
jgi:hypothetical protein